MNQSNKYQMKIFDKTISIYLGIGSIIQLYMIFFFGNWMKFDLFLFLGFFCCLVSIILVISSNILRQKGEIEGKGGFVTTKLVDSGIYGIIRHPIYLSLAYLFIGLALVSQHPLSMFLGITMAFCCYYFMVEEEKLTFSKFGESYVEYKARVPRSNLIIGIWRYSKKNS